MHSDMGTVWPNPIQRTVRTALPFYLQTNIVAQMLSMGGEGDFAAIWHMDATWDCKSGEIVKYTSGQTLDGGRRPNYAQINILI